MTAKKADLEEVKQLVETGEVSETRFDDDISELINIYGQMDELVGLVDLTLKPTSLDIQKMATSVWIERNKHKVVTAPTPEKVEFRTAKDVQSDNWECPGCHESVAPRHSQTGKKYYSCKTCKSYINSDKEGKRFLVSWDDAKNRKK